LAKKLALGSKKAKNVMEVFDKYYEKLEKK